MPQLNPAPWFAILTLTWLVFLVMIPPKILAYTYPNEPATQSTQKPETIIWAWPWH